mgnify:CR=1 FL=1
MTASSKTSAFSRFIPREEIDAVAAWSFSAMDVGHVAPPPAPVEAEPEPAPAPLVLPAGQTCPVPQSIIMI